MLQWHTSSGWLTAVVLIAGLVLWWWTGRGLARAAGRSVAWVLRGIRVLGLLVLIFLLMNLQLTWESGRTVPPTIAVYVDNSRSMAPYREQVFTAVDSLETHFQRENVRFRMYQFGSEIVPLRRAGDLDFSRDLTDLSLPITHLQANQRAEDIQGAVIISDGRQNTGMMPQSMASAAGVPIYTLFIGDSTATPDVQIQRFLIPQVSYAGDSTRADVRVSVQNLQHSQSLLLRFGTQSGVLAVDKLTLQPGTYTQDIHRNLVISSPGTFRVAATLDTVTGEQNTLNNKLERQITVRPSRYKILVAAGTPSYETRFLLQAIRGMEKFTALTYFQDLPGQGNPDSLLAAADLLYVIGTPKTPSGQTVAPSPADSIRGIIYQEDSRGELTGGTVSPRWQETTVQLGSRRANPLFPVLSDPLQWSALPPIWVNNRPGQAQNIDRVLLRTQGAGAQVISTGSARGQKLIYIHAAHLWRWQFVKQETQSTSLAMPANPYQSVLSQLFFWLLQKSDADRLQVWMETRQGNTVQAEAQVFTTAMEPVQFARVWGEVTDSAGTVERRTIFSRTDHTFLTETRIRTPGRYRLRTVAYMPDDTLEQQSPMFTIPPVDFEDPGGTGNPGNLQALSEQFSGKLLQNAGAYPLKPVAGRPGIRYRQQHAFHLRAAYWILGGLILLFAVDWWVRRRNGLL